MEKNKYVVSKTVDAKKVLDDGGVVIREWPAAYVSVDYSFLTDGLSEDKPGDKAMLQHLKKYAGFLLQHDASTAHRSDKATGDGPGWKWDNERKLLTAVKTPWTARESGSEKAERENLAILEKVDARIRAGEVAESIRQTLLDMMEYKGTPPPYRA